MTATVMTGLSVTFATGFLAEITSISHSGVGARSVLETSHAGTSTWRTFTPGLLQNPGTVDVTIWFVPGTAPPWGDAAETVTITYADAGAATFAASGFMFNFDVSGDLEELHEATAQLQLSGSITHTP